MSTDRKTYVTPKVEALGTPAEIVQISKALPNVDEQGFTFVQPFPGEFEQGS